MITQFSVSTTLGLFIRVRWWRGQHLQLIWPPPYFPPVTIRNSLINLKKVEDGCFTHHACYICARQIIRSKKNRYHLSLSIWLNVLFGLCFLLPQLPGRIGWFRQKNCEVGNIPCTYDTHVPEKSVKVRVQLYCLFVDWLIYERP